MPFSFVDKGTGRAELETLVELGRSHDQLILVHQMGKVGSRTVIQSLRRHFRRSQKDIPIFHSHFLNGDRLQHQLKRYETSDMPLKAHLVHAQALRCLIDQHQALETKTWKLITLVRDPIARNVSGFFQNIRSFFPQALYAETEPSYTQKEIEEVFLNRYGHSLPLTWLDEEITSVFGIDPYGSPFPWQQGYQIYRENRVELLLIRLENLTPDTAQQAFKELLGLEGLELKQKNVGDRKHYSDAYKRFQAQVQLPQSYLDRMYDSRYAQQFYSPAERQQFRQRWNITAS
ncbi:MAG: putative capsular polysaccharide synthesis family protein [Elainellaceae cyanobacterium]